MPICYDHNNHRLAKTRPHVWSMMTSQLKVFINNISERNENIQKILFCGENKWLRFEQNRFYGNSLPRGRPSRDRSSCEVLSNPPFSYDTFDLTLSELLDLWPESEKPRQRVSNADRNIFADPESFWDKFIIGWRISGYFAIQSIQIICSVRMIWKVSGRS